MMPDSPYGFDWLLAHAATAPRAPFLGTPSGWVDYGQAAQRMERLALHLAGGGLAQGDLVLLAVPNSAAAVIAALAVQSLGAIAVEVGAEWGAESLSAIARQTKARHAVVAGRDARLWRQVCPLLEQALVVHPAPPPPAMLAVLAPARADWLDEGGGLPLVGAPPAAGPPYRAPRIDAPAQIVYTSGSTGPRRGVVQTWRNIDANTRAICGYLELGAADRVMSVLPLHHCYGKSLLQTHLLAGGSVFFDRGFVYPRAVMQAVAEQACTGFAGVPLTFELLRRHLGDAELGRLALRYVTQAGGPMPPETLEWARRAFAPAPLFVMYGQTEATARLSFLPPAMAQAKAGSIGRGVAGIELQVVDEAGRACAPGVTGHLVARGDSVTPGYFDDPGATAEILHDGWLWTGDQARRDADGYFYIVGRSRDMLKIRGTRVSAVEIEQCLCAHPTVSDAAVVGTPDRIEGECATAFVVTREHQQVDPAELRRFCRERGPAYMVPKSIVFIPELPRTSTGKVAKAELKARISNP